MPVSKLSGVTFITGGIVVLVPMKNQPFYTVITGG